MKKRFLALALVVACCFGLFAACGSKFEELNWDEFVLGEQLPEAPGTQVKIYQNTKQELWIYIPDITAKQYADYIESCKSYGYTIDAVEEYSGFTAYNAEGYKLEMNHSDYTKKKELSIILKEPLQMDTIVWPSESTAGQQLPVPESTTGTFSYEYDDNFYVYIGEMDRDAYEAYVAACVEKGFDVDYSKGDDYYRAENEEGWSLSLTYEGNSVISISIKAPNAAEETTETIEITTESATEEVKTTEKGGIDPDFKKAMDSYEKFMDEYIVFMEKFQKNPNDLSLVMSYAQYMQDYTKCCKDFEAWESRDLNAEEMAYYIEVQNRVSKKLLDAAI